MRAYVRCVCVPLQGLGEGSVEQGKAMFPCPKVQSRKPACPWSSGSNPLEGRTGFT